MWLLVEFGGTRLDCSGAKTGILTSSRFATAPFHDAMSAFLIACRQAPTVADESGCG
jgi:hypothetical protein